MSIGQLTIEQKQENMLIEASLWGSDAPTGQGTLCAWCLSEQGMDAGNGSHGICTQHADSILKQWRERAGRRRN